MLHTLQNYKTFKIAVLNLSVFVSAGHFHPGSFFVDKAELNLSGAPYRTLLKG
jgi:hypothetical protein